jgi:DNA-binding beta-propeller fold protein YncE
MNLLALLFAFVLQGPPPPPPPPPPPCPPGGTKYICGQQAPEDLVLVPGSDWVVASVFAGNGGIRVINTKNKSTSVVYPAPSSKEQFDRKTYDTCPAPPSAADKAMFRTHGLALRAGRNSVHALYVVHHGSRESIEVFELDARAKPPVVTWVGCVVAPDKVGLNSVVGLPDGFAATNFLAPNVSAGERGKMLAGENNGEIWEWHSGKGWKIIPGSEASGPNGLELSKDGKTLYVAAWGSQSFFRLTLGQTPPKRDNIPLGFRVDNIRWAPDGSLFATGQGGAAPGTQTSNIVKINPNTLKVQELITQPNNAEFGAGTVTVQVGKELWVGSFRGDRIAIFPATK